MWVVSSTRLQTAVCEHCGVPNIMDILFLAKYAEWQSSRASGGLQLRCTLGMIWAILSDQGSWTLLRVLVLGVASHLCLFWVPLRHPLLSSLPLWWDIDGFMPSNSRLGTWTVKASPRCLDLNHLSDLFIRKSILRPKAVRALGCPCVPGFGLTLCMGRELDHKPKQWGYPGRTSCWWQQTNISHYIFPFSEGHSLSS